MACDKGPKKVKTEKEREREVRKEERRNYVVREVREESERSTNGFVWRVAYARAEGSTLCVWRRDWGPSASPSQRQRE